MKKSTARAARILVRVGLSLFSLAMMPVANAQEAVTTNSTATTTAAPAQPAHHHHFWHHCAKENNLQPGQKLTDEQKQACFAKMQTKCAAHLSLDEGTTPSSEQMHQCFADKRAKREAFRAACHEKLNIPADQKLTHEQLHSCKAPTTTST